RHTVLTTTATGHVYASTAPDPPRPAAAGPTTPRGGVGRTTARAAPGAPLVTAPLVTATRAGRRRPRAQMATVPAAGHGPPRGGSPGPGLPPPSHSPVEQGFATYLVGCTRQAVTYAGRHEQDLHEPGRLGVPPLRDEARAQ